MHNQSLRKYIQNIQNRASDPSYNIYVDASAGSGKTKVLIDRILRIISKGHSALCITYTNAAAKEMESRLKKRLLTLSIMNDNELYSELETLEIKTDLETMKRVRGLHVNFYDLTNIQTLHSLAMHLLGIFGMVPSQNGEVNFMSKSDSLELMKEAIKELAESESLSLPHDIAGTSLDDVAKVILHIKSIIDIRAIKNSQQVKDKAEFFKKMNEETLSEGCEITKELANSKCFDEKIQVLLIEFFSSRHFDDLRDGNFSYRQPICEACDFAKKGKLLVSFDIIKRFFFTEKGEYRKKYYLSKDSEDHIKAVSDLRFSFVILLKVIENAKLIRAQNDITEYAWRIIEKYKLLKKEKGVLEYDDVILSLIESIKSSEIGAAMLYQIDAAIDYILIDEAQDLSSLQWYLIDTITEEFYSGIGAREIDRTIFIVGDYKQSIFSFQGANPEIFLKARDYYKKKVKEVNKLWGEVKMDVNFRSSQAILDQVDKRFVDWDVKHKAFYSHDGAVKEIYELGEVADRIESWLADGRKVIGTDKKVSPSDIMILIRKRSGLSEMMHQELLSRGIPVVQHMQMERSLELLDILAIGDFVLRPHDDINLVSLLKSPLIGISEHKLFDLCYERKGSVWQSLLKKNDNICELLSEALSKGKKYTSPISFYEWCFEFWSVEARDEYRHCLSIMRDALYRFSKKNSADLRDFQSWVRGEELKAGADGREGVRIMTIHGAKGLESPIVVFCDMEEKERQDMVLEFREWFVLNNAKLEGTSGNNIRKFVMEKRNEEKRRLAYVAMTRAKNELYLLKGK